MDAAAAPPDIDASALRRAAAAGNPAAQTRLGKRLLVGEGMQAAPEEGAALIAAAAQAGDGEAAAMGAVLIGIGARSAPEWMRALDYLQASAENGWAPARQQLAVLAGDPELGGQARRPEPPPDLWGRLRRSIDLAWWWKPPPRRDVSLSPRLTIFDGFLTPSICGWVIGLAQPLLARSRIFNTAGEPEIANARTNSAFEFGLLALDMVMLLVRGRIAAAAGCMPQALEHTNVLHYAAGQEFARHYDFLDPQLPGQAQEIALKGQRVATFLVYLNEDYSGGETEFPLLKQRFRCPSGGALLFFDVEPSGAPDRRTLHAGLAPVSGEKWLLSQWIRGRV